MSRVRANNFTDKAGTGAPTFPYGVVVTGVVTATSFSGAMSGDLTGNVTGNLTGNITGDVTGDLIGNVTGNLTGTASTATAAATAYGLSGSPDIIVNNLTVNGTETILNTNSLEVEDKNIGIASVTPKLSDANLDGAGITIHGSEGDKTLTWSNSNSRMQFNTDLYATAFYGDGSNLTNVISGVELKQGGSSVGTAITQINFESGATLTTASSGISTVTIAAGIQTTASSPSANTTVILDLNSAQHHELTLSAGITTLTCSGGSMGESHSVILIQPSSGIATVGFSTYFLFPSGATPAMSEGSGKFDLISFVVKRVGAGGTQLLASAGLNYQ